MDFTFWIPTALALISLLVNTLQGKRIKVLERENQEYMVIRKLQFETEFSAYQKLSHHLALFYVRLVDLINLLAEANEIKQNGVEADDSLTKNIDQTARIILDEYDVLAPLVIEIRPFIDKQVSSQLTTVWLNLSKFHNTIKNPIELEELRTELNKINALIAEKIRPPKKSVKRGKLF